MKSTMSVSRMFCAAVFALAIVGCAPAEKRQSAGEYIDDAWITS
jgi:hypothetical protein